MKRVLPVMMLGILISGCGQQAPEDVAAPVDAPQSQPQANSSVEATTAPAENAQQNILPTPSTTFASQAACVEAGYGQAQCARAYSTAQAMATADRPIYKSLDECKALFADCLGDQQGSQFAPGLAGFSIGNEAKTQGELVQASVQAPLFHAPIFKNAAGQNVFILRTANNSIQLVPVEAPART